jgi:hypothetical protein
MCYANSGGGVDLPLETIEKMMDFYKEAESGSAEVLQNSGGRAFMAQYNLAGQMARRHSISDYAVFRDAESGKSAADSVV